MGRLLLLPILLTCALTALVILGARSFFKHPSAGPNHQLDIDIEQQRHLAECYRMGCPEAYRSAVMSCAWRLVIADETQRSDDVIEAANDCNKLDEKERHAASAAKDNLWQRLPAHPTPARG